MGNDEDILEDEVHLADKYQTFCTRRLLFFQPPALFSLSIFASLYSSFVLSSVVFEWTLVVVQFLSFDLETPLESQGLSSSVGRRPSSVVHRSPSPSRVYQQRFLPGVASSLCVAISKPSTEHLPVEGLLPSALPVRWTLNRIKDRSAAFSLPLIQGTKNTRMVPGYEKLLLFLELCVVCVSGALKSLLISLFALYPALSAGVSIDYCAKLNTGSNFDYVVDGFQSIGACQKTCGDKYAFAILQGKTCWCSNAAPGNTVSNDKCNQNCPGYPDDKCGSASQGLYAYIVLDKKPTTTIGSSSMTTSSSSTKSSSSSATETPSVTTVEGQVTTITVPNGPTKTSTPSEGTTSSSLTGGAIAGIIIGTLAAFGIFAAILLWFCCFRRRQQTKIDDGYRSPFHESPVPQPIFESTLSSRVPAMRTTPVNGATVGRRGSTARLSIPAFTDHRMKKDAMVYANGGRHSNVSLQDNQDYSRPVLRLTNPDPDDR
ncbi:uncharacterized protein GIQ15_06679 [Arthroderma uncinatum]|uniref:uncharacterized protein n=1 Tax=Arthroderma uncinatum TaxID=74035 RepID=UPI00144A9916|nr:uncharacterized protein GIQ15_06679 [Arthroderma uncinatum]KAF3479703.1 hypothetical protein GIQ15_06679 [Arthroderma uncinatum]